MKRVLMVSCYGLGNGGVQSVMMNIIRSLKNEYHFDMLLFTNERRYYDDEFENYGEILRIPIYEGNKSFRKKLDYYIRGSHIERELQKLLQTKEPYDVIHCNNEFESGICVKVAAKMGIGVRIVHSHTAPKERKNKIRAFIDKHYATLINKYATVSLGCSKEAARFLFGNTSNSMILHNAIDLHRFDLRKYPQQKRKNSFIHVGLFCENKNQMFVVEVFSIIHKKYKDATLTLIGNGEEAYINKVKNAVEMYDISDSVKFLPHDSDIPALMADSEFMILPSHSEGFSLVTLEAQAMGTICFVSENVPECVNLGRCNHLNLDSGSDFWADFIMRNMCSNMDYPLNDMSEYSIDYYTNQICALYEGKELEKYEEKIIK